MILRSTNIRSALRSRQRGFLLNPYRFGVPVTERIYMDFEGANGSQVFTDIGTGASTWTWAGSAAITTATVLAGTSSLSIPTTSSSISTSYTTGNRIPPTGDWTLTFKVRASSAGGWVQAGAGTYVISCQNSTATAAGTAFALATSSAGKVVVILSDGTTRSVIVTGATTVATNTDYTFTVTRVTNTITLLINGVSDGSGTFSGTINTPAGQSWRIGQPAFAANPSAPFFFDTFRLS
jgi:hypothetical protein